MVQALVDLATINLTEDVVEQEELRRLIPHDHEFRLVDGICHLDLEEQIVVGYKEWGADPWWGRGHIPGRPIMPGVLMIEGSAQVATFLMKRVEGDWAEDRFIGLAGVDGVRFRGMVKPNSKIFYVSKVGTQSRRLARYPTQCFQNGKMVMNMELLGIPL